MSGAVKCGAQMSGAVKCGAQMLALKSSVTSKQNIIQWQANNNSRCFNVLGMHNHFQAAPSRQLSMRRSQSQTTGCHTRQKGNQRTIHKNQFF
jgi:hypothetical protein